MSAKPWSLSWAGEASARCGSAGAGAGCCCGVRLRRASTGCCVASRATRALPGAIAVPPPAAAPVQDRETDDQPDCDRRQPEQDGARAGGGAADATRSTGRRRAGRGARRRNAVPAPTGGPARLGRKRCSSASTNAVGRRPALAGLARKSPQQHVVDRRRQLGRALARARRVQLGAAVCDLDQRAASEGQAARQRLEGHDSEARSGRWPAVAGSPSACSGEM